VARFLSNQNPGYTLFAQANASRQKVLWVGAGDGMLHAFNATNGAHIMSYVPEALVPRLSGLTTQTSMQAYVDGSPFTADVDINSPSATPAWRTYLFSSLGRGGRGVFALDTTNPSALTAANASSIFKWQFTANDDADMGYIMSDYSLFRGTGQASPIVKLQDGTFAAVFGNGTGSTTGKAVLFLLPVQGPNATGSWTGRYHRIVLDNGTGNGLSTPTMVDTNNDGMADTVYAGDFKGNLWKVDLSSATPTAWGSAYVSGSLPTPLYIATSGTTGNPTVPITGAPQYAFSPRGGLNVTFATGRSVDSGDYPRTDRVQRVFGIWDRPAFATNGRALPRLVTTLVPRTATRAANGDVTVTGAAIDYTNPTASAAKDGWYFNLPGSSEMVVSNLDYVSRNIAFTSIRPPTSTSCVQSPLATLYLVDLDTGMPNSDAIGTTTTTDASGNTVTVSLIGQAVNDQRLRIVSDGTRSQGVGGGSPAGGGGNGGSEDCNKAIGGPGPGTNKSLCFDRNNSRIQWREIPGLRTR
jgi:type IV pilus assembly protein PilY1